MSRISTPFVLAIVGPTAVGKTAVSIRLGQRYRGQVLSADSRQVYHHMDIGTAKASATEQATVPHHLIDIVEPNEILTLAQYLDLAKIALAKAWESQCLPMVVGGTGLYVRALLEGWTVPKVPPDYEMRDRLRAIANAEGAEALHALLHSADPEAARRIDARNVRRVVRALEVCYTTGEPISDQQRRVAPGYRVLKIGLTAPRLALYSRIDERIARMIEDGLVDEVRWLLDHNYDPDLPSMSGLGYRQVAQHLSGEISLDESVALIKRHTRRFVRQQYNWFRLSDKSITWFDLTATPARELFVAVESFLSAPASTDRP